MRHTGPFYLILEGNSILPIILNSLFDSFSICVKTIPILILTILIVDLLSIFGLLNRISFIIAPIAQSARLSQHSTMAFVTSIASSISADSMTARFLKDGTIDSREALLSAQANTIPAYLRETITYFLPVIIPLLGLGPGLIYVSAFFLNVVLKIAIVLVAGRFFTTSYCSNSKLLDENKPNNSKLPTHQLKSEIFQKFKKSLNIILQTAGLLFISSFIIIVLDKTGSLCFLSFFVKPVIILLGVPENLFLPICGYIASPSAGAAAMGTLYKSGNLSLYCTAAGALVGGLLSLVISTLRYTIPRNIALFGLRVGCLNVTIGFCIAFFSRVVLIVLVAAFIPH